MAICSLTTSMIPPLLLPRASRNTATTVSSVVENAVGSSWVLQTKQSDTSIIMSLCTSSERAVEA
jgi:hypothetical protein